MTEDNHHPHDLEWKVLKTENIYESPWVSLDRCDVAMPDGTIIEGHHLVRFPRAAVGVVPVGEDGRILLVEHHRFATQSRGWEIICGRSDAGEEPEAAARRELMEEVGATAGPVEIGLRYYPAAGTCRLEFVTLSASGVVVQGAPSGPQETGPPQWFTRAQILAMIGDGRINQGLTVTALLWHFQTRPER